MPRALAFCYPEDLELGSPEALLDLVESIGAGGVAVALTYHRARRVFPRPRRVVHAPPGCTSFQPSAGAYGALAPAATASRELHDRLFALRWGCARRGLAFHAWLVALHHEPLARRRPELAAQTVDGTPAEHALCPSHDEVAEFCAALAGDACRQFAPDGVELEAALYPAWEPAYTLTLALDPLAPRAAAFAAQCFCGACERLLRSAGHDPKDLRARAAAAAFDGGEEPGAAAALAGVRADRVAGLLAGVREAADGVPVRVLGFGAPELLGLQGLTDASAAAAGGAGMGTGTLTGAPLARHWAAVREHLPSHAPLATVNWAPGRDARRLAADARALARGGAGALGLYNLSLVPERALPALRAAASAFDEAATRTPA